MGWKVKKHPVIFLSSMEDEYRVISKVIIDLSLIVRLLADLGVLIDQHVPIYYDTQAITRNPMFHKCTKHNEVDCNFTCQ